MRKPVIGFTVLFGSALLLAHQGHDHQMLGKVVRVRPCHFVMQTTTGEEKTIFIQSATKVEREGAPILPSELVAGQRVSVTVEDDGETAVSVKAGATK